MTRNLSGRNGEALALVACDAENVTLEADFSSPPGSTLELCFGEHALKVKVRGCRRVAETAKFRLDGRWVSLSRAARSALLPEEP